MCHRKERNKMVDFLLCMLFRNCNKHTAIAHFKAWQDAIHHIEPEQLINIPVIADEELIEEGLVVNQMELTCCQEFIAEIMSTSIRELGSFLQSLFTHQRHVDCHEKRHQTLIATDVRGGLLTTDMLFTRLKRQHKGTLAAIVFSHAHDTTRHLADEFLRAAHIAYVRSSELHGDTQTLAIAHSDVSTPLARGFQHSKISSNTIDNKKCLIVVTRIGKAREILNDTTGIRLLNNHASHAALCKFRLQIVDVCHTILLGY